MKRIAICYYGMTRSLHKVYQSHHDKIFNKLQENNIEYTVFMHTWHTKINNEWNRILETPIDYNAYQLLSPDKYKIDNEDDFLDSLVFSDYFDENLYNLFGGNTFEWHPYMIRNHLCALESTKRVTQMVLDSVTETGTETFDYVLYLRPDVEIQTDFLVEYLDNMKPNEISFINRNFYEGYSDTFALVCSLEHAVVYGMRIDEIKEFRKTQGRITGEKYSKYIADKYFDKKHFIDFGFDIVRIQ